MWPAAQGLIEVGQAEAARSSVSSAAVTTNQAERRHGDAGRSSRGCESPASVGTRWRASSGLLQALLRTVIDRVAQLHPGAARCGRSSRRLWHMARQSPSASSVLLGRSLHDTVKATAGGMTTRQAIKRDPRRIAASRAGNDVADGPASSPRTTHEVRQPGPADSRGSSGAHPRSRAGQPPAWRPSARDCATGTSGMPCPRASRTAAPAAASSTPASTVAASAAARRVQITRVRETGRVSV